MLEIASLKIDNESHYLLIIPTIAANVKKNRDKFADNYTNWVNYTHNFRESQKNLQKISKIFSESGK